MRERYWTFFSSISYKMYYYKHFQLYYSRINKCISAFLTFTTISSIGAWTFWDNHQILWASLICMSQVIQALFPKLPYNDTLIAVQFMISATEKLRLDIENDWLCIDVYNLSDKKITKLLIKHQLAYAELVNQFFSGVHLPENKFIAKKAELDNNTFFAINYKV